MFYNCYGIRNLPSRFRLNPSFVDMRYMFYKTFIDEEPNSYKTTIWTYINTFSDKINIDANTLIKYPINVSHMFERCAKLNGEETGDNLWNITTRNW